MLFTYDSSTAAILPMEGGDPEFITLLFPLKFDSDRGKKYGGASTQESN